MTPDDLMELHERRRAHLLAVGCAHPTELRVCERCDGEGRECHAGDGGEDVYAECRECFGTCVTLDAAELPDGPEPEDAPPHTDADALEVDARVAARMTAFGLGRAA